MVGLFDNMRVGYDYDLSRGWINPRKVAKTTYIAPGVGLGADYDPTADTYRQGVNGTQESAMQRAMRWAQDMVNSGQTTNYQNALNFAMANLSSDLQRGQAGQQPDWNSTWQLGWDPAAFRYNQMGEAYNDEIDYANPTVRFAQGPGTASGGSAARGRDPLAGGTSGATGGGGVRPQGLPIGSPPAPPGVAPVPGQGTNNGAGPVMPPASGGPGSAGGPASDGGLTRRTELAGNPQVALQYVMDKLGINMERPGLYAKDVRSAIQDYVTPFMQMAGDQEGISVKDDPERLLGEFVNTMRGGGGYGRIADMAARQSGTPTWRSDVGALGAEDAQRAIQNNIFLRAANRNQLGQAALAARMAAAFGDSNSPGRFGMESLNNPNLHPLDWLAKSPWADLLSQY